MSVEELVKVDRALEAFLGKEIAIPGTAREKAAISQKHLREVLRNKAKTDVSFPEVLSGADTDFLGGSFARHTKIWPLDDIDLFLPMDGGGLMYSTNDVRLPFTIAGDTTSSRLGQDRWKTNGYVDSTKILRGIREGIRDTYPTSEVQIDKHCVNLQTTVAATSESDGIGFDVVPCFRLLPDDGSESFYLVPDGASGWIRSSPRKDTDLCAELHKYHQETYRKAVRLVKYWNKTQIGGAFTSYYIELALSRKFSALKQGAKTVWYVLDAYAIAMTELRSAYLSGDLVPLIPAAPSVQAPALSESQQSYLEIDATAANTALTEAYNNSRSDAAFQSLSSIFTTEYFG